MEMQLSQKLNENVFIEVDDAEDFAPEVKIEFVNGDIKLTKEEKFEIGHLVYDYLVKKFKEI